MSPKEKAKELYDYYFEFVEDNVDYKINTKRCAYRVVAEIISEFDTLYKIPKDTKYVSYWEEVNLEITLL